VATSLQRTPTLSSGRRAAHHHHTSAINRVHLKHSRDIKTNHANSPMDGSPQGGVLHATTVCVGATASVLSAAKGEFDAIKRVFAPVGNDSKQSVLSTRNVHTVNYTGFERLFEGPLRDLLLAQDECVTSAHANAISSDGSKKALAKENLSHCPNAGRGANITNIWAILQDCEYAYTNALLQTIEETDRPLSQAEKDVREACQFPKGGRRDALMDSLNDFRACELFASGQCRPSRD
jgi:hypothetical protein